MIEEITRLIAEVQSTTIAAVAAVTEVASQIEHIAETSGSVAAAVEQENAATREIARNVSETASAAQEVSERIEQVASDAQTTMNSAMEVCEVASSVADSVAHLRNILIQVVRTSTTEADRRRADRHAVDIPATITAFGQSHPVTVTNISTSGAELSGLSLPVGATGGIIMPSLAETLSFKVINDDGRLHVQFGNTINNHTRFNQVITKMAA